MNEQQKEAEWSIADWHGKLLIVARTSASYTTFSPSSPTVT